MAKQIFGLGERVRNMRELNGEELNDVAFEIGCKPEQLEAIERGVTEHAQSYLGIIYKFAERYGIDLHFILTGREYVGDPAPIESAVGEDYLRLDVASRLGRLQPNATLQELDLVFQTVTKRRDMYLEEQERINSDPTHLAKTKYRRQDRFNIDDYELLQLHGKARTAIARMRSHG